MMPAERACPRRNLSHGHTRNGVIAARGGSSARVLTSGCDASGFHGWGQGAASDRSERMRDDADSPGPDRRQRRQRRRTSGARCAIIGAGGRRDETKHGAVRRVACRRGGVFTRDRRQRARCARRQRREGHRAVRHDERRSVTQARTNEHVPVRCAARTGSCQARPPRPRQAATTVATAGTCGSSSSVIAS
jgi:hypothetical protein